MQHLLLGHLPSGVWPQAEWIYISSREDVYGALYLHLQTLRKILAGIIWTDLNNYLEEIFLCDWCKTGQSQLKFLKGLHINWIASSVRKESTHSVNFYSSFANSRIAVSRLTRIYSRYNFMQESKYLEKNLHLFAQVWRRRNLISLPSNPT